MTTTLRRGVLALLPLLLAVALAACGGNHHAPGSAHTAAARAAASAKAYANSPQAKRAEAAAKTHAQACAKAHTASLTGFVKCAAPKGTFKAVLGCVRKATIGHLFSHPVKAAEAAAPGCVTRQEQAAKR